VHRAFHHLVDVGVFDVVARDQAHHVIEDLEVLIRVLPRHHAAEEAAEDRERNHGRGDGHHQDAGAGTHSASGSGFMVRVQGSALLQPL
jgi:hypothetical protein